MNSEEIDAYPFFPEPDSELETLAQEVNAINLEKEKMKSEVEKLSKELEEAKKRAGELEAAEENRRRLDGARILFEDYSDAMCFNCESKEHLVTSCKSRPILK